jgi:hypothetical protein
LNQARFSFATATAKKQHAAERDRSQAKVTRIVKANGSPVWTTFDPGSSRRRRE